MMMATINDGDGGYDKNDDAREKYNSADVDVDQG